jgi:hypothetical protein
MRAISQELRREKAFLSRAIRAFHMALVVRLQDLQWHHDARCRLVLARSTADVFCGQIHRRICSPERAFTTPPLDA